jgi:phosphatidylinositol alpha-1,6-mannosyltransferase
MRNLLITLDYPPNRGGVARYLEALVKTFHDEFTVWSQIPTGDQSVRRVSLVRGGIKPSWLPSLVEIVVRSRSYDRVWISHIHPLGLVAYLAKFITRKPYIVILHGFDFRLALRNPWKRFWTGLILSRAEQIICNTQYLKLEVQRFCSSLDPVVVYPTIPDAFSEIKHEHDVCVKSHNGFRLITVARLVPRKNHVAILGAVSVLPNVQYDIVGDGSERETLEKKIDELGLGDRVKIHTEVTDAELARMYAESDAFVLVPTADAVDVEGFGIVYLEAALAGLPIIAEKLGGVSEALCEAGSIQLLDVSSDSIAKAIEELMHDRCRREAMGEANKKFAQKFTRMEQFSKLKFYV